MTVKYKVIISKFNTLKHDFEKIEELIIEAERAKVEYIANLLIDELFATGEGNYTYFLEKITEY